MRPPTAASSSSSRLQVRQHASHGSRPRIASISQVKDETRVAQDFPTKTSWSDVAPTQEFLDFSNQMHVPFLTLWRLGARVSSNVIPTCLAIIYLANTIGLGYWNP